MVRLILFLALAVFVARAVWKFYDNFLEGLRGRPAGSQPQRAVQMVRDPVCGTFVVPDRAVVLTQGSRQLYFCSTTCRDKYRAQRKNAS
jgi:YHS domain-containing protein